MDQKKLVGFLGFWVVNAIVLLVASVIFGDNVVLGNSRVSTPMAAIISGLIITGLTYLVQPLVDRSGFKVKGNTMAGVYLVANIVFVWIIKRFALLLGLGVVNILYTILVGVLLTIGQWAVAKATGQMATK